MRQQPIEQLFGDHPVIRAVDLISVMARAKARRPAAQDRLDEGIGIDLRRQGHAHSFLRPSLRKAFMAVATSLPRVSSSSSARIVCLAARTFIAWRISSARSAVTTSEARASATAMARWRAVTELVIRAARADPTDGPLGALGQYQSGQRLADELEHVILFLADRSRTAFGARTKGCPKKN